MTAFYILVLLYAIFFWRMFSHERYHRTDWDVRYTTVGWRRDPIYHADGYERDNLTASNQIEYFKRVDNEKLHGRIHRQEL